MLEKHSDKFLFVKLSYSFELKRRYGSDYLGGVFFFFFGCTRLLEGHRCRTCGELRFFPHPCLVVVLLNAK